MVRDRVVARLRRIELGNLGDVKPVGEGVGELRSTTVPDIHSIFVQRGDVLVVMLCGGDKKTQAADIARAKQMAEEL